jgi:hypothetical protein
MTGLWAAIALAVVLAATAGSALADNPHNPGSTPGNSGNAPGQEKKQDQAPAATTTAAPAATPGNSASAPGQEKKAQPAPAAPAAQQQAAPTTQKSSPGQAKKSAPAPAATSSTSTKAAHTASDGSKKYGNGNSALEIAKQTKSSITIGDLSEPGNSGKHKITICHNGHLITIDVHALKAHARHLDGSDVIPATSASQCRTATTASTPQAATQQQSAACGSVTTTTTTTKLQRGHAYGRLKHGKSLHSRTVTTSQTVPTGQACGSSSATQQAATVLTWLVTTIFGANGSSGSSGGPGSTGASATGGSAGTGAAGTRAGSAGRAGGVLGTSAEWKSAPLAAGGVAGVSATLPAKNAHGGVLGVATKLKGTLPFTGFPLWIAALAGLFLLVVGATLVRRSRTTRITA